jgi:hypothetical protein
MAGAPLGNQNAAKAKRWQDALWKALQRYSTDDVPAGQALDKIAEKVVKDALTGSKDAWQEIGNRLDGKPAQIIGGDPDNPLEVKGLAIVWGNAGSKPPTEA